MPPRSSDGNSRRSSGCATRLSSCCTRPAQVPKRSSTLLRCPSPSRPGVPGSPCCRSNGGTNTRICAACSSSCGGQVSLSVYVLPFPFPFFGFDLLPFVSRCSRVDWIVTRFVCDVCAYDQAAPQSVWRAETRRKTQDALTHSLL